MRTTIEIKPEHRVRLVALAARRDFRDVSAKERARQSALRLRGIFSAAEAERFRKEVRMMRESRVRGLRLA